MISPCSLRLLTLILLIQSLTVNAGQILQCIDKNGRKVFTDDPRICAERAGADSSIAPVEMSSPNLHSQYGATVSEEYRNYSFRAYTPVNGYNIRIMAEDALVEENPEILHKASGKLDRAMAEAIGYFPLRARAEFGNITYYLFTGHEANSGGRKGGQWYFRKGNSISKRFDDSIVVRSASRYLRNAHESAVATGVHELAHAYYHYHRRALAQKNRAAYQNASQRGLYQNVKAIKGHPIAKAYALTNEREYFAEISKTYLYKNDHYPFDRRDLEQYDPVAYDLMRDIYRL